MEKYEHCQGMGDHAGTLGIEKNLYSDGSQTFKFHLFNKKFNSPKEFNVILKKFRVIQDIAEYSKNILSNYAWCDDIKHSVRLNQIKSILVEIRQVADKVDTKCVVMQSLRIPQRIEYLQFVIVETLEKHQDLFFLDTSYKARYTKMKIIESIRDDMDTDYEGSNQIFGQVCSTLAQGIDKDLGSNSILDLDLRAPIDQQFLRKQKRISLPTLGTIKLEKLSQMSFREIKSFLKDGFPKKLTCLSLNYLKPSTIGPYLNWLKSVSYQVLSKIEITNFEISELQSRKLFRAFRHVEAIEFVSCEFSFPRVPDFSKALSETSINTLCLQT